MTENVADENLARAWIALASEIRSTPSESGDHEEFVLPTRSQPRAMDLS